jgi:hypothetical protein
LPNQTSFITFARTASWQFERCNDDTYLNNEDIYLKVLPDEDNLFVVSARVSLSVYDRRAESLTSKWGYADDT